MDIIDVIKDKQAGKNLSREELDLAFNGYIKGSVANYQMAALLMAICINGMSDEEVFDLTDLFINSGEVLDLSSIPGVKVDKHSTGGVGDKVTLIVGPIVASCVVPFAKMCGRGLGHTGGTIDKLESIPGFNVSLKPEEFINQIKNIGIAITSQTGDLTPMDKEIYSLRDATGTANSVPLIASSVMSKKIASGADKIIIDITLGSGALIQDREEAEHLSELMKKIGEKYNREVRTIISDMDTPLGHNIGNALEIIEAMEVLQGKSHGYILEVCRDIASELLTMGKNISKEDALNLVDDSIANGTAYQKFLQLVKYQHGRIEEVKVSDKTKKIKSNVSGILKKIDSYKIGVISGKLGAGRRSLEDALDYGAGVKLEKELGEEVKVGDTLCTLYVGSNSTYNDDDVDVMEAFVIK